MSIIFKALSVLSSLERHFGLTMLGAVLLGLTLPGAELASDHIVTASLIIVMLLAWFKIDRTDLRVVQVLPVLIFYFGRFICLPVAQYWIADVFIPDIALAVLLLGLMPAGVASPAISGLIGGNVALVLILTTLSSLLTPFLVPLIMVLVAKTGIGVGALDLFGSLSLIVFLPLALYWPVRRHNQIRSWMQRWGGPLTVLSIAIMVVVVIARRREYFFSEPLVVTKLVAVLLVQYLCFYVLVWFVVRRLSRAEQISYVAASGVNKDRKSVV